VLTIRDDKIADIQDCARRPQAERIAYRNWRAGHGLLRLGVSEQLGRGSFEC